MFGKSVLLLFSFAALCMIGAMTISCGSSNSSTVKPCTGGPYNVVGPWQMTVTDNGVAGSVTLYGAIDSSGLALFFDNSQLSGSGDTVQLPTITGACSFSGNVTAYGEPGGPNSGVVGTNPVQGNVTSSTAISGTFSGNPSGTISLVPLSALGTGTVTAVTGQKLGVVQGSFSLQSILLSLTFSQSGSNNSMSFTTTNLAGCLANGTFTEVGTSNVFDVSLTLMPTCPITGTFTGLGFESSTDYFGPNGGHPDTYLYMNILDSTNSFVMEIY
jgi:hypothetical protein